MRMAKKGVKKGKDWRPHAKQIKMAELLINPEDRRTKEAKCKEVGITYKTLWTWMKDERFVNYMNSQIDKYVNGEMADVWRALLAKCKRGDIQAIKLLFEVKEIHPSTKHIGW